MLKTALRFVYLSIFSLAMLQACGDDSGSSSNPSDSAYESDLVVATYDDLPVCSSKREGAIAYVKDEKTAYVCENGNWKDDSEKDTEPAKVSSSSKAKSSSSSSKKTSSSSSVAQGDAKQSSSSEKTGKSSGSVNADSPSSAKSSASITPSSSSWSEAIGSSSSSTRSSSSSVQKNSSSSEKAKSSSSKDETETKTSSSSVKSESSSSVEKPQSSSSEKEEFSSSSESSSSSVEVPPTSSETESSSSNGEDKINCSALLEGKTGWSWDVPKECRFNPDIDYGSMTDERDGKVYKTVKIGDQTWMAENLNYADSVKTASLKGRSWCFNKVAANCDVAGRLYRWAAAIDSMKLANDVDNPQNCGDGMICTLPARVQGICPTGWHLPSQAEWNVLITAVGGQSTSGKVLKSQSGWNSDDNGGDGNGTDAFGFSALPAGFRTSVDVRYTSDGGNVNFWCSTEGDSSAAYRMYMARNSKQATLGSRYKDYGFSVRCLKD